MGYFRFRRRIKLFPGAWINLSKGFPSLSVGGHGLTANVGKRWLTTTISAPGTGLSYRHTWKDSAPPRNSSNRNVPRLPNSSPDPNAPTRPNFFGYLIGVLIAIGWPTLGFWLWGHGHVGMGLMLLAALVVFALLAKISPFGLLVLGLILALFASAWTDKKTPVVETPAPWVEPSATPFSTPHVEPNATPVGAVGPGQVPPFPRNRIPSGLYASNVSRAPPRRSPSRLCLT